MMMHLDIHSFLGWLTQNPYWAIIAVFIIAVTESLVVVGLIVPGAILMVSAGALIGMGVVSFWPILFAAIIGAIVGDGVSFWFGHHYRDRVHDLWPFSRHPEWFGRSERFFMRHGTKSVLFGRFVGPVRPIIPVVAGMLGMSPAKFYKVNILSAFAWAPGYLLPGMAFGASLALAGEVAARLMVLLVLLGVLIWAVLWLIRWVFLQLSPRAEQLALQVLAWSRRHSRLQRIIGGLVDPSLPEQKTLLILAILLIAGTWIFLELLENLSRNDPLLRIDQSVFQLLQLLRTPWGDRFMVLMTQLGDGVVIVLVSTVVLIMLMWQRNWRAAGYWVAAVAFGQLVATLFKLILQRPRPIPELYDGISAFAFPSGHATMSMVVYGFLAVLIAHQFSALHRWLAYALAALLITSIAVSRLYLGAHWLSDVLGGLSLGLVWISLLGIAYFRHPAKVPLPRHLPVAALLAVMLAGGWHIANRFAADMQRYAPRVTVQHLDSSMWWQHAWQQLPTYRQDLEGEHEQPLNLQWKGPLSVLSEMLRARGWQQPVPLRLTAAMRWLLASPTLSELPILPQVHSGRHESLLMRLPASPDRAPRQSAASQEQQLVLRLWNTGIILEPDGEPLWVGNVSVQQPRHILMLTFPVTTNEFDAPLTLFMCSLKDDIKQHTVIRPQDDSGNDFKWDRSVLLIQE